MQLAQWFSAVNSRLNGHTQTLSHGSAIVEGGFPLAVAAIGTE